MAKYFIGFGVAIALAAILYMCGVFDALGKVENNGYICSNYSGSNVNEMDKSYVLQMIRNYHAMQYQAINADPRMGYQKAVGCVDSRAVFFSLDTLKRLIYYIEKASRGFSSQDRENLGVNIYYASYPAKPYMEKFGYDYTNRHTLVFIPSIFSTGLKRARDFDLYNSLRGFSISSPHYIDSAFLENPANNKIACLVARIINTPSGGSTSSTVPPADGNMNSQNHGTAIPPPPANTGNVILDETDPH